jgi:hypothetical protein
MTKLLLVLSVMLIGLSGCYVRGHDEGHHRGTGHHDGNEHQRGHDDGKHDHDDRDRGGDR